MKAIYSIAPATLQRGAFVAVLSFLFFIAMMVAFYVRDSPLYFLLASAFLIIYLVMMISWIMQRRTMVQIFEGGVTFKNQTALWPEITEVSEDGVISLSSDKPIMMPKALNDLGKAVHQIRVASGLTHE